MEIVGYSDLLSVAPGDSIRFMVSTRAPSFAAALVRLAGAGGPDEIPSDLDGAYAGRAQELRPGSYVVVEDTPPLEAGTGFTLEAWVWPATPGGRPQALAGCYDGPRLRARSRRGGRRSALPRRPGRRGRSRSAAGHGTTSRRPTTRRPDARASSSSRSRNGPVPRDALRLRRPSSRGVPRQRRFCSLRGAIPRMHISTASSRRRGYSMQTACSSPVGTSAATTPRNTSRICRVAADTAAASICRCGQSPVTLGAVARRTQVRRRPTTPPSGFDDDLEDARWEPSIELRVPESLPSGAYAMRVSTADADDELPFFVRPSRGTATADIAVLMPTLSYLAYGNEHNSWATQSRRLRPRPDPRFRRRARPVHAGATAEEHLRAAHRWKRRLRVAAAPAREHAARLRDALAARRSAPVPRRHGVARVARP